MASEQRNDSPDKDALVAEIISVVQSGNDRWFYEDIVGRIPELHIRTVLKKIQTEPPHAIGHPRAYFFNHMVAFAETLRIELPEPVMNDCYVTFCQGMREFPQEQPLLCSAPWHEFERFKPEALYEETGIVGYEYEEREPWLRALAYEEWRMHVFIREKELDAMRHDPYLDKYFPPDEGQA